HMDLHGGILKALGEANMLQEGGVVVNGPLVSERQMMDTLDKLQTDMHIVKSILNHEPDIHTQPHQNEFEQSLKQPEEPVYDLEMIALQLVLTEFDLIQAHR
ncbi:hypothetical protein, partial [Marinobacter antarcticus]|uniref:hypothetical protein n=1 Tax=Marinobacter antarcticus TaxID=564117 RepID=UPI0026F1AE43